MGHSFRRTNAISVRHEITQICKLKTPPREWFALSDFLARQGWSSKGTFMDYTRGFEIVLEMGAEKIIPGKAVTRSVKSSKAKEKTLLPAERRQEGLHTNPRRNQGTQVPQAQAGTGGYGCKINIR